MVLMSVLNNALNGIVNAERRGKRQVLLRPASKVTVKFLQVMMKHGTHRGPNPTSHSLFFYFLRSNCPFVWL
jgi:hypothetical protein